MRGERARVGERRAPVRAGEQVVHADAAVESDRDQREAREHRGDRRAVDAEPEAEDQQRIAAPR